MNYRQELSQARHELLKDFQLDHSMMRSRYIQRNERILELTRQGLFSHEIGEIVGCSAKAVQKFWVRHHFPVFHNLVLPKGEDTPNWKGELSTDKYGYVYRHCPGHPLAHKYDHKIRQHRLVMEEHLGRYLTRDEVVHHIDNNPSNNDISNLELFESNAAHLAETIKGQCPVWTDDGKQALDESRDKRSHKQALIRATPENLEKVRLAKMASCQKSRAKKKQLTNP